MVVAMACTLKGTNTTQKWETEKKMEWRVKSSQEGNHPIVNAYHLHTILVPLQPCKFCAANLPFSARCSSDFTADLLAKKLSDQVHHLLRALHDPPSRPQKLEAVPDRFVGQIFSRSSSGTCPATQASQKGKKNYMAVRAIRRCPASHFSPEGTKEDGEKERKQSRVHRRLPIFRDGGVCHVAKSCGRGQARRYPAHRQPNPLLPDLHPKTKTQEKKQKRNLKKARTSSQTQSSSSHHQYHRPPSRKYVGTGSEDHIVESFSPMAGYNRTKGKEVKAMHDDG